MGVIEESSTCKMRHASGEFPYLMELYCNALVGLTRDERVVSEFSKQIINRHGSMTMLKDLVYQGKITMKHNS